MDYRTKLSELSRSDLNTIAKKLKIKNYSHGTKGELVELIVSTRTSKEIKKVVSPSLWNRYHNHVYGVAGLIGLFLTLYFGSSPTPTNLPPQTTQDNQRTPVVIPTASVVSSTPMPSPTHIPQTVPTSTPSSTPNLNSSKQQILQKRESASTYINQARALFARRQYPAALANIKKALKIEPNNQEALSLKNLIIEHISIINQ